MSRIILFFLIVAPFIPSFCYGDILTVDDDAPADYTRIQDAINAAYDGDTVEVAEGHYYENIDFRGKAITVTSTDPCDPCTIADTIIDANGDGIVVSFHSDEGPDTVITGFTITGGYAKYGAGVCCWGGCSPIIENCIIHGNTATNDGDGGGIYCNRASPIIRNCKIRENSALGDGYDYGRGGGIACFQISNPKISKCIITYNSALQGGGIYFHLSQPEIVDCFINDNSAIAWGGGLHCSSDGQIYGCAISNNSAHGGGGIFFTSGVQTHIYNCAIFANSVSGSGGGIYSSSANPSIEKCLIIRNSSSYDGGGVYISNGSSSYHPSLINCEISDNLSNRSGGGIYSSINSTTTISCNISKNTSVDRGGGIFCSGPCTIRNCIITGNLVTNGDGGGIYCCILPTIINCTINGNKSTVNGAGVFCAENSSPLIKNSIISNNSHNGVYAYYSDLTILYNNVWGNVDSDYSGWAYPGEGDISVDPCFVDPGHWEDPCNTPEDLTDDVWVDGDYHLQYDSLCINAGDPCFAADPCEVDMDGESRVRLGRVDIGADEAGSNPADFDESGLVDLSDFDALSAAWLTVPEDTGWNRACDISEPADDVIDLLDLSVYSEQWLWQAQWYIP